MRTKKIVFVSIAGQRFTRQPQQCVIKVSVALALGARHVLFCCKSISSPFSLEHLVLHVLLVFQPLLLSATTEPSPNKFKNLNIPRG